MAQPAAKAGDQVEGIDFHIVMVPAAAGALVPGPPSPHKFKGTITGGVSRNVTINGQAAAIVGSTVQGVPHIPIGGPSFQKPPTNSGQVNSGSSRVTINGKPAARSGDKVMTCNDPVDAPNGTIIAQSSVLMG
jgi:uncharacterized Zn-binding protein involved in type VI secretion